MLTSIFLVSKVSEKIYVYISYLLDYIPVKKKTKRASKMYEFLSLEKNNGNLPNKMVIFKYHNIFL